MKLSAWAGQQGRSYKTARPLWKTGKLPVSAEQLATAR
jgi:predicted site-specific integrase-resolvase